MKHMGSLIERSTPGGIYMSCRRVSAVIVGTLCVMAFHTPIVHADVMQSEKHRVNVEVVTGGLRHPWGMTFLPSGDILVTERPGRLRLVKGGRLLNTPISGLPKIRDRR